MANSALPYAICFASVLASSAIENCYVKPINAILKPQSEIWTYFTVTLLRCAVKCYWDNRCVTIRYMPTESTCFAYDYRARGTRKSPKTSIVHVICKDEDYVLGEAGRLYFMLHRELANWTSAQGVCRREGGELITLDTREKYKFIAAKMRSAISGSFRVWTSLRRGEIRKYKWPNDNDYVFRWNKGDPSFFMEHCCYLKRTGLADAHCFDEHQFLCEKQTRYFDCL